MSEIVSVQGEGAYSSDYLDPYAWGHVLEWLDPQCLANTVQVDKNLYSIAKETPALATQVDKYLFDVSIQEEKELASNLKNPTQKDVRFIEIIRRQLDKGDPQGAIETASQHLTQEHWKCSASHEILQFFLTAERYDEAMKFVDQLVDHKENYYLEIMMKALERVDLQKVLEWGEIPSKSGERAKARLAIAKALLKRGRIDDARQVVESIVPQGLKDLGYAEISQKYLKNGLFDEGLAEIQHIQDPLLQEKMREAIESERERRQA